MSNDNLNNPLMQPNINSNNLNQDQNTSLNMNMYNTQNLNNGRGPNSANNNYSTNYKNPEMSIKWRNVMKIDINAIRNTNDLTMLNEYLENILYSDISEEEIQAVPENNIVRLIQILQFTNEYLLNSRQNLNDSITSLQDNNDKLSYDQKKKQEILLKEKLFIDKYNKEKEIINKDITDCKNLINVLLQRGGLRNKSEIYTKITDININKNNNILKENGGFRCKYCTAKIFSSEFELKRHLTDIHLINIPPEEKKPIINQVLPPQINVSIPPINGGNNNNNQYELEKRLNDMRIEFQEYMHKIENENLKQLKQKELSDNEELYKRQMERMGNTFNDTLKQLGGFFLDNQNNSNEQEVIKKSITNVKIYDPKNDKYIIDLKDELNKAIDISKNQKNLYEIKIKKLEDEMELLRQQKLEEQKKFKEDNKLAVQMQQPEYFKNKKTTKLTKYKKARFHSGILESDHDESDEEKKKKAKKLMQLKFDADMLNTIMNPGLNIVSSVKIKKDEENIKEKLKKYTNNTNNESNNTKIVPQVNVEKVNLDDFYYRYTNRDNKYILKPDFNNYLINILPDEFNLNNNVRLQAKSNINNKMFNTCKLFYDPSKANVRPNIEIDELVKEDKEELFKLINNTFHNFDLINKEKNGQSNQYYNSIKEVLNLPYIKGNLNNFFNKPKINVNNYSIDMSKNNYNDSVNNLDKNNDLNKFYAPSYNFNNNKPNTGYGSGTFELENKKKDDWDDLDQSKIQKKTNLLKKENDNIILNTGNNLNKNIIYGDTKPLENNKTSNSINSMNNSINKMNDNNNDRIGQRLTPYGFNQKLQTDNNPIDMLNSSNPYNNSKNLFYNNNNNKKNSSINNDDHSDQGYSSSKYNKHYNDQQQNKFNQYYSSNQFNNSKLEDSNPYKNQEEDTKYDQPYFSGQSQTMNHQPYNTNNNNVNYFNQENYSTYQQNNITYATNNHPNYLNNNNNTQTLRSNASNANVNIEQKEDYSSVRMDQIKNNNNINNNYMSTNQINSNFNNQAPNQINNYYNTNQFSYNQFNNSRNNFNNGINNQPNYEYSSVNNYNMLRSQGQNIDNSNMSQSNDSWARHNIMLDSNHSGARGNNNSKKGYDNIVEALARQSKAAQPPK